MQLKSEIVAKKINKLNIFCVVICGFQRMYLPLLLLIFTFISLQIRFSFLLRLNFLTTRLHQDCLDLLPKNPATEATLKALVCGHNFESFQTAHLYTSSGLIHLFVVSGSHLILVYKFLDFIFQKIKLCDSKKIIFTILFLYCAVCLFNAPIVRSFLGLLIFEILHIKVKYWPKDYVLLLVGFLCLMISPEWIDSLSLQMSWLAALAIESNHRYLKNSNSLLKQLSFYVFYIFTFSALGFPQVSILIIALFFNPVLEFILIPLAFLVLGFPFLDPVFEIVISVLNTLLSYMELSTSEITTPFADTLLFNWSLILSIHFILHFNRKKT
jgi:ComEC/Rec2-related protein